MKNLIAFHGSDHKAGTTMISQSVAELIAKNRKEIKVLWIVLGLGDGREYKNAVSRSLEDFRLQIYSHILSSEEVTAAAKLSKNLFMLGGIKNFSEQRLYFPEHAKYFLECIMDEFDLIIADCGNDIDNGLAIGALENAALLYMMIPQKESGLHQYEIKSDFYSRLKLNQTSMILSHFYDEDPITLHYTAKRLGIPYEDIFKVQESGVGRQAERDKKNLLFYDDTNYKKDIFRIADSILRHCELGCLDMETGKRKKRWINFI
ncbi:hypothetical protein [Sinanaerobacter sp. ZZT-01]|uniref:hypothetical protein n=1 Tax=Sinanaerobacter sp. ZZT-01 TaxID=3111540 RepID=UPI002D78CACF|nr:hypothetical protein [Sinanaerobacter sp. ZZT-01]WRR92790.1 hypothetical protein U5921_12220 [Sinanaerobacter sp. ZZT-01]